MAEGDQSHNVNKQTNKKENINWESTYKIKLWSSQQSEIKVNYKVLEALYVLDGGCGTKFYPSIEDGKGFPFPVPE